MITKDNLRAIAKRLIAKTKTGDVRWEYDDDYNNSCILNLGTSYVRIQLISRSSRPDVLELSLLDGGTDNTIATLPVEEAKGDPDWELLSELYDEAARI